MKPLRSYLKRFRYLEMTQAYRNGQDNNKPRLFDLKTVSNATAKIRHAHTSLSSYSTVSLIRALAHKLTLSLGIEIPNFSAEHCGRHVTSFADGGRWLINFASMYKTRPCLIQF
jgi:hypothetical protein